jgi:ATPase subunit of ABC transporter with duplicated ATPase domains
LDLHALVWLEHWLVNYFKGIVLTVSHDQVFLDSICTDILELKSTIVGQSKSSLTHYSGDFSTYQNTLEENRVNQARLRVAYEKERETLQEFISREGKKYDNPAHQAQRNMKKKQLEKLTEVEKLETETELILKFPKPYCVFDETENLICVQNLGFAWTDDDGNRVGDYLFKDVDFTVCKGSRVAILGKNGCGKTSLLNILSGDWPATVGTVKRHAGSRITVLHQHHYKGEQLDPNLTPLVSVFRSRRCFD